MINYVWNNQRELIRSSSTPLHRGDLNVGTIYFNIPSIIDEVKIDEIPLLFRYTLPNGDTYIEEIKDVELGYKEGINRYSVPISKELTSISGNVEFDLRFEQLSEEEVEKEDKPSGEDKDDVDLADKDDLNDLFNTLSLEDDESEEASDVDNEIETPNEEPEEDSSKPEIRIYSNVAYIKILPNSSFYSIKKKDEERS